MRNNKLIYKSVTIKVGSNVLTRDDGSLNVQRMEHLVGQIGWLHKQGIHVILISSGAVAAGRDTIRNASAKDPVAQRQLLSSVGQVKLVNVYSDLFEKQGLISAQVLATKQDFSTREHYLNMKNCFSVLLDNGIVPVVNENDAVSVTALMFTDNDELAGLVASMMDTDALLILSNVDGIFTGVPGESGSELISEIREGVDDLDAYISATKSDFGRGGMLTKCRVARKTAAAGVTVHIANGTRDNVIIDLISEDVNVPHTRFVPNSPRPAIKKWMAYADGFAKAEVVINKGAKAALTGPKARSLLLAGVVSLNDDFKKGDLLRIKDENGQLLGIGRAQYDRAVAERHLHDERYRPLIHYDYLFIYPDLA
ncbi:glutamate 5-kinase [Anaerophaga thermohalophila]|uniref:glutamate 5-kinase n=1 Tax=Anaerophaga thermohalophila TaxID=177400 RepID=UPI000237BC65|nr:glutamate 5-kinase [Anaerophaga thermohalophila]